MSIDDGCGEYAVPESNEHIFYSINLSETSDLTLMSADNNYHVVITIRDGDNDVGKGWFDVYDIAALSVFGIDEVATKMTAKGAEHYLEDMFLIDSSGCHIMNYSNEIQEATKLVDSIKLPRLVYIEWLYINKKYRGSRLAYRILGSIIRRYSDTITIFALNTWQRMHEAEPELENTPLKMKSYEEELIEPARSLPLQYYFTQVGFKTIGKNGLMVVDIDSYSSDYMLEKVDTDKGR